MKEFKVQMFIDGKWCGGRMPNQGNTRVFRNKQDAINHMDALIIRWDDHRNRYNKDGRKSYPVKFRIMSRDVTEWEEV